MARNSSSRGLWVPWAGSLWHKRAGVATLWATHFITFWNNISPKVGLAHSCIPSLTSRRCLVCCVLHLIEINHLPALHWQNVFRLESWLVLCIYSIKAPMIDSLCIKESPLCHKYIAIGKKYSLYWTIGQRVEHFSSDIGSDKTFQPISQNWDGGDH